MFLKTSVSFCLLLISMLVPTLLFGATLPVGVQALRPRNERSLVFHVQSEKSSYFPEEPIELTFWIENSGSETEFFWAEEEFEVAIIDEHGRKLKSCGAWLTSTPVTFVDSLGRLSSNQLRALGPSQATPQFPQDILSIQPFGKPFICREIPKGNYKIFGEGFKTDTVFLSVHLPDDQYNLSAINLFQNSAVTNIYPRPFDAVRDASQLLQIVERYPLSPIIPRVLGELLRTSADTSFQAASLLITGYPSSTHSVAAISLLDRSKIGSDQIEAMAAGLEVLRTKFADLQSVRESIDKKLLELRH